MRVNGTIRTPAVNKAFLGTDRAYFVFDDEQDRPAFYVDMPLRQRFLHLSAPSIYATALEGLNLSEGLSFLNVGSGTGYLSSLASSILGHHAIHYALELKEELITYSREKLDGLGHAHVRVIQCSCFDLDPDTSMRFDRIYVAAGACDKTASLLFRMLAVGGIIVGPFASPQDGSQRLLKAQRVSEVEFHVQDLLSVQFTPLVLPHPDSPKQSFSLVPPRWSIEDHSSFPPKYRAAVNTLLLVHAREGSLLSLLPKDLLLEDIFPLLPYAAFAERASSLEAEGTDAMCTPKDAGLAAAAAASAVNGAMGYGDFEEEQEEDFEEEEEGEGDSYAGDSDGDNSGDEGGDSDGEGDDSDSEGDDSGSDSNVDVEDEEEQEELIEQMDTTEEQTAPLQSANGSVNAPHDLEHSAALQLPYMEYLRRAQVVRHILRRISMASQSGACAASAT